MPDLDWAIVYKDRSTYTSADGPFEKAPRYGWVACVIPDEGWGRRIYHGAAPHVLDEWNSIELAHIHKRLWNQWLVKMPEDAHPVACWDLEGWCKYHGISKEDAAEAGYIVHGITVPQPDWWAAMQLAHAMDGFPPCRSPKRRRSDYQAG